MATLNLESKFSEKDLEELQAFRKSLGSPKAMVAVESLAPFVMRRHSIVFRDRENNEYYATRRVVNQIFNKEVKYASVVQKGQFLWLATPNIF